MRPGGAKVMGQESAREPAQESACESLGGAWQNPGREMKMARREKRNLCASSSDFAEESKPVETAPEGQRGVMNIGRIFSFTLEARLYFQIIFISTFEHAKTYS